MPVEFQLQSIDGKLKKKINALKVDRVTSNMQVVDWNDFVKLEKKTTKVRIVFDAAAKCKGVSLNDVIHQGPKLQRDLCVVLLQFRRNAVALLGDITEMYLQIELNPKDRRDHRFLWRDLEANKNPELFEFTKVVFGVNSSPFQAIQYKHMQRNIKKVSTGCGDC
ncbi:uncharacterized protein LOC124816364 [Hydra vulgaris]|uniref:uncharacterized protein LOC124816364 n=1 Tax=Hydra vulgaris TaxID=6087 RepID=UPI001F5E3769|nr:uncharacterized protein LOC124816364 [Hydra vulgaris]